MTHPLTHTAPGTTLTVPNQPVPISCPAWCAGGHLPGGDPFSTWFHESTPHRIPFDDHHGTLIVCLYRVDERKPHETIGGTRVSIVADLDDHHAEYALTFAETHTLLGALLDSMNLALPPGEQTVIGPPGFEYVRGDSEW